MYMDDYAIKSFIYEKFMENIKGTRSNGMLGSRRM